MTHLWRGSIYSWAGWQVSIGGQVGEREEKKNFKLKKAQKTKILRPLEQKKMHYENYFQTMLFYWSKWYLVMTIKLNIKDDARYSGSNFSLTEPLKTLDGKNWRKHVCLFRTLYSNAFRYSVHVSGWRINRNSN